ncbi:hypothetical protein JHW43_001633 [Diplocarpon mali]|nr:hypothetical protein JHW43_001633 [Diplocarpon mali]
MHPSSTQHDNVSKAHISPGPPGEVEARAKARTSSPDENSDLNSAWLHLTEPHLVSPLPSIHTRPSDLLQPHPVSTYTPPSLQVRAPSTPVYSIRRAATTATTPPTFLHPPFSSQSSQENPTDPHSPQNSPTPKIKASNPRQNPPGFRFGKPKHPSGSGAGLDGQGTAARPNHSRGEAACGLEVGLMVRNDVTSCRRHPAACEGVDRGRGRARRGIVRPRVPETSTPQVLLTIEPTTPRPSTLKLNRRVSPRHQGPGPAQIENGKMKTTTARSYEGKKHEPPSRKIETKQGARAPKLQCHSAAHQSLPVTQATTTAATGHRGTEDNDL